MSLVFAAEIGATSLWLLYGWLISAATGAWLSHRKGYGERPGLASGLIVPVIGPLVWLVVPPREDSLWKKVGPFGRPKADDIAPVEPGAASAPPAEPEAVPAPPAGPGERPA
jgi:hypothetical protein